MDTSCIFDLRTTSETVSTVAPHLTNTLKIDHSRVRSGASVILDPEGGLEVENYQLRKLPSSRYKGVVPQPNGRWGAQIYEKHQRVWLGTFNEEEEAAKAYDIAVQRFRGGRDAVTNFKHTIADDDKESDMEASFLNSHSKSEIVDMLRKHTYNDELEYSKRSRTHQTISQFGSTNTSVLCSISPRQYLFQKKVTPSDVGKLNRLVIPKQHAEKHFPVQKGGVSKGVLLHFEDNKSKIWRFRYSYWNSSQSYVLTKGWSSFVRENNLKAGDSVCFQSSTGPDKQFYIECKPKNGLNTTNSHSIQPVKVLRLFGVDISSVSGYNGKRSARERDLLGFQDCKKQITINVL